MGQAATTQIGSTRATDGMATKWHWSSRAMGCTFAVSCCCCRHAAWMLLQLLKPLLVLPLHLLRRAPL
jgi:hypothetical protein